MIGSTNLRRSVIANTTSASDLRRRHLKDLSMQETYGPDSLHRHLQEPDIREAHSQRQTEIPQLYETPSQIDKMGLNLPSK